MERIAKLFRRHVGQTSPSPISVEICKAEGIYMYTPEGDKYIDLISGVSVCNVGHSNKDVVDAVCAQAKNYMHLMVYGELIQSPQVEYAVKIGQYLPEGIDAVYFVNSGSEAVEGALKLAKRYTGRRKLVSFKNAYHGSTHGALSMMGGEYFKSAFRPLLPDVLHIEFNNTDDLEHIDETCAGVIVEPIQGEGGFIVPDRSFLEALRRRCSEKGVLLIFDEIQTGGGRTGKMFAWEHFGVKPDIVAMAKAIGGGMPLGAFAASYEVLNTLTFNPVLGHITTFGGHPVCCAAGLAAMNYIEKHSLMEQVESKRERFVSHLEKAPLVKEIRGVGLLIAIEFGSLEAFNRVVPDIVKHGVLTESFLFCESAMRIAPPLTITMEEIDEACDIIISCLKRAE